jgi:hypothetical protein
MLSLVYHLQVLGVLGTATNTFAAIKGLLTILVRDVSFVPQPLDWYLKSADSFRLMSLHRGNVWSVDHGADIL